MCLDFFRKTLILLRRQPQLCGVKEGPASETDRLCQERGREATVLSLGPTCCPWVFGEEMTSHFDQATCQKPARIRDVCTISYIRAKRLFLFRSWSGFGLYCANPVKQIIPTVLGIPWQGRLLSALPGTSCPKECLPGVKRPHPTGKPRRQGGLRFSVV